MAVGEIVLVRSFPSDPLIRQVYEENGNYVLVWRGTKEVHDLPSPCPKNRVFVYDPKLIQELETERHTNGSYSEKLKMLWKRAKPYYCEEV
jgi:hypothetical protein